MNNEQSRHTLTGKNFLYRRSLLSFYRAAFIGEAFSFR